MQMINAAKVTITNAVTWNLILGLIEVFDDESKDMAFIDVKWHLEFLKEDSINDAVTTVDGISEHTQRMELSKALDDEPDCRGWREMDVIYLWPD